MHFPALNVHLGGGGSIKNKCASVPTVSPLPTCSSFSPNVATSDPAVGPRHWQGCAPTPCPHSLQQLYKPQGQQLGLGVDISIGHRAPRRAPGRRSTGGDSIYLSCRNSGDRRIIESRLEKISEIKSSLQPITTIATKMRCPHCLM